MPKTPAALRPFFSEENYQFSTYDKDFPTTTFYFEDGAKNRGRIRRAHKDGQAVVYQGKCFRAFVTGNNVIESLLDDGDDVTQLINYLPKIRNTLELLRSSSTYEDAGLGAFQHDLNLSAPRHGWYVFDYILTPSPDYHGSKGYIKLNDSAARQEIIDSLLDSIWVFNDWTNQY